MATRKVNHSRRIRSKTAVPKQSGVPFKFKNIIEFKYSAKDIYDKIPMVFVLKKKGKILTGINIGYLKEYIIEKLLEETNFKKLKNYSLYEKAFRTYKISDIKMVKLIDYETLSERKLRLKNENKL